MNLPSAPPARDQQPVNSVDSPSPAVLSIAERLKQEGNQAFGEGAWELAIQRWTEALQALHGNSPALEATLLGNLALLHYRMGRYAASLADAEAALRCDGQSAKARRRSALACLALGWGAQAAAHLTIALSAGGDADDTLRRRADALAAHGRLVAGEQAPPELERLRQLLQWLRDDVAGDGDADFDGLQALLELGAILGASPDRAAAAALVEREQGFQLLMLLLASEPTCAAAAAALRAAGAARCVLWPSAVWHRLVALACGAQELAAVSAEAMRLLAWAAQQDEWVRTELMAHPLPPPSFSIGGTADADDAAAGPIPLACVLEMLRSRGRLERTPRATVAAVAALVQACAGVGEPSEALLLLVRQWLPITALLSACEAAEGMDHSEAAPLRPPATAEPGLSAEEREALGRLREKQRAVWDAGLVALRRSLLAAAAALCARQALVAAEAVARVGPAGASKAGEGPLVPALMRVARHLHSRSPKRTAPVLGPDGQPASYAKRPFAADFNDNPTGDFLVTMDLSSGGGSHGAQDGSAVPEGSPAAESASRAAADPPAPPGGHQQTQLELALAALLGAARGSRPAAALLHRRGILELCGELCLYTTPTVVLAAQRVAAAVAAQCRAAAEELTQEPQHLLLLPGLLLEGAMPADADPSAAGALASSGQQQQQQQQEAEPGHATAAQQRGLEKLCAAVDTCSGDEFALLCGAAAGCPPELSAVLCAFQLAGAGAPPSLAAAARCFVLLCADRARQQQGRTGGTPPRGGAWDAIGGKQLAPLVRQQPARDAQKPASGLDSLRRGFLGPAPSSAPPAQADPTDAGAGLRSAPSRLGGSSTGSSSSGGSELKAAPLAVAAGPVSVYRNGATIQEISDTVAPPQQQHTRQAAARAGGAARGSAAGGRQEGLRAGSEHGQEGPGKEACEGGPWPGEAAGEEGEEGQLRQVYNSSPSPDVRRARQAWLSAPAASRLRWQQTSTDVSAYVALPAGTAAREVAVEATAETLCVRLGWYGRVLHGRLRSRVKPREVHWCLEDSELHVLLPKADDAWWRSLLEGGEERSYTELLQEAVHADEPVVPCDAISDEARGLLDRLRERQALIAAGLIDPESSFDDFRLVIGEASLGGSGGR